MIFFFFFRSPYHFFPPGALTPEGLNHKNLDRTTLFFLSPPSPTYMVKAVEGILGRKRVVVYSVYWRFHVAF